MCASITHEGDEHIVQETPTKNKLWTKIEKIKDAIGNNLWYGPKSHIFRIAKIEKGNKDKEDYFDLGNGEKVVYIDGTFFLYTNTSDPDNKNIKILDTFTAKEPWSEPFLNQKKVIYDPTQQTYYIAYTFSQDLNDKWVFRSQEIPMIIIKEDKIMCKPMIEALSSVQEPIIELANPTTFCIKTSMGWKIRCQYCDIIHNQTRIEESNDNNAFMMRKM